MTMNSVPPPLPLQRERGGREAAGVRVVGADVDFATALGQGAPRRYPWVLQR